MGAWPASDSTQTEYTLTFVCFCVWVLCLCVSVLCVFFVHVFLFFVCASCDGAFPFFPLLLRLPDFLARACALAACSHDSNDGIQMPDTQVHSWDSENSVALKQQLKKMFSK